MDFTAFVKELELESMPLEEQQAIVDHAVETVMRNVSLRLDDILTDEQKNNVDKVAAEQGDEAAAQEILRMYPDYPKLYQEELDKLKDFLKKVHDKTAVPSPKHAEAKEE